MVWVRTIIWLALALLAITVVSIVLRGGVVPQEDPLLDGHDDGPGATQQQTP